MNFPPVIVTTADTVDGRPVSEYLGVVRGVVTFDPAAGMFDPMSAYEGQFDEAYSRAQDRVLEQAQALGAEAVVGLALSACSWRDIGFIQVLAYGTAVRLESG